MQRKARQEAVKETTDDDECDLDMEQFMTVDSIGDVDGHNGEDDEPLADKKDATSTDTDSKQSKQDINVGNEHVKKIEVYYCELCHFYLPYNEEQEAALKKHCCSRGHLRTYLRYKENQSLRMAAERIHRKHQEQRDARKEKSGRGTTTLLIYLD